MFSGIVSDQGSIVAYEHKQDKFSLEIQATDLIGQQIKMGESISVNGVCLTILENNTEGKLYFDVCRETLKITTAPCWKVAEKVNLERAMQYNDKIGGHLITGHIDRVVTILEMTSLQEQIELKIQMPQDLRKAICTKGCIAIDGMSLTINQTGEDWFGVLLIPHTLKHTIVSKYKVSSQVNLEIDMIARYIMNSNA